MCEFCSHKTSSQAQYPTCWLSMQLLCLFGSAAWNLMHEKKTAGVWRRARRWNGMWAAAVTHNRFMELFNNAEHWEDRCFMVDAWQGSDCMFDTISRAEIHSRVYATLMMRHQTVEQRHFPSHVHVLVVFCKFSLCVTTCNNQVSNSNLLFPCFTVRWPTSATAHVTGAWGQRSRLFSVPPFSFNPQKFLTFFSSWLKDLMHEVLDKQRQSQQEQEPVLHAELRETLLLPLNFTVVTMPLTMQCVSKVLVVKFGLIYDLYNGKSLKRCP